MTTNSTTVEDAVEAARAAAKDARDAIAVEGATANTAHGALNGLNTALMNIDEDLGDAADTIHMGFSLSTPIAPDAGPYVVVIATEADNPTIDVTFTGVLATDSAIGPGKNLATAQDTYNVMVWATHPGLFMIKTTGMELMVKGTFPSTTSTERKGQNVAWTVPIPADTAQTLTVDPQDRAERGEFGLMLGYMQAMELAEPSTAAPMPTADGELKTDMQTQYFFLASTKTQFLTVASIKHADENAALDTTGTLYGPMGMVTMDEDSGENNGFRLRAPISGAADPNQENFIIKVMGVSPSVVGEYTVQATSEDLSSNSADLGMIPGTPTLPSSVTLAAGMLAFYTFEVTMPGTLQIKSTTPSGESAINTHGTLYGPDGREVEADDDGADPHFQIVNT